MSFTNRSLTAAGFVLVAAFAVLPCSTAADPLKEYLLSAAKGEVDPRTIHDHYRGILFVGGNVATMDKQELTRLTEHLRQALRRGDASQQVLEFEILNKYQRGKIISVVTRGKVRGKMGATEFTTEQISHSILQATGTGFITLLEVAVQ